MEAEIAVALGLFALLVIGAMTYALVKLWREPPPQKVSPRSQKLARLVGLPKLFDGLVARPLTRREKFGWLLFALIAFVAVVFTG